MNTSHEFERRCKFYPANTEGSFFLFTKNLVRMIEIEDADVKLSETTTFEFA